jgi:recombination protein RecA
VAAFVDAEHAFDPDWAGKCGVDVDSLLFSQPDSGEEAFDIVEQLVESGLVDVVIVDSVAALIPRAELDGEIEDSHIGIQARLMSKGLRKIKGKMSKSQTTVVFINQIRHKIGVMFGSPETTPGGLALKFYASIRAQINKGSPLKDKDTTVGFRPTFKIIKNKVAAPFTTAEYEICVGAPQRPVYGIDETASLVDVGSDMGIITKKSSYFYLDEKMLGNGLTAATAELRGHPEVQQLLREKIYGRLLQKVHTAPALESGDDTEEATEKALSDEILDIRDGDD